MAETARSGALALCVVLAILAAAGLIGGACEDDLRALYVRLLDRYRDWRRRRKVNREYRRNVLRGMPKGIRRFLTGGVDFVRTKTQSRKAAKHEKIAKRREAAKARRRRGVFGSPFAKIR
ncbi:MAG: hypothetical protein LBR72_05740 [Oscillospiraceae bacterium]|nr:hypothetical protein [Oscillospiraceae bacterium]